MVPRLGHLVQAQRPKRMVGEGLQLSLKNRQRNCGGRRHADPTP